MCQICVGALVLVIIRPKLHISTLHNHIIYALGLSLWLIFDMILTIWWKSCRKAKRRELEIAIIEDMKAQVCIGLHIWKSRLGTPRDEFWPLLRQLVFRSCLSKPLVQNLSETFTLYTCQGMIWGIMNPTNSAIQIKGSKKPKRYLFILVYLFVDNIPGRRSTHKKLLKWNQIFSGPFLWLVSFGCWCFS